MVTGLFSTSIVPRDSMSLTVKSNKVFSCLRWILSPVWGWCFNGPFIERRTSMQFIGKSFSHPLWNLLFLFLFNFPPVLDGMPLSLAPPLIPSSNPCRLLCSSHSLYRGKADSDCMKWNGTGCVIAPVGTRSHSITHFLIGFGDRAAWQSWQGKQVEEGGVHSILFWSVASCVTTGLHP